MIAYKISVLIIMLTGIFPGTINNSLERVLIKSKVEGAKQVLSDWVITHNSGSDELIKSFIINNYHPDLLTKIKMEDHIVFYKTVFQDFGKVEPEPYEKIEETSTKLIVHMIKEGIPKTEVAANPEDILVVEIDMDGDGVHLSRGLGLGALICKLKEK